MARVNPWYSILESDPNVYHNSDLCTEGNNIEPKNRRSGTDNRPRCKRCDEREEGK